MLLNRQQVWLLGDLLWVSEVEQCSSSLVQIILHRAAGKAVHGGERTWIEISYLPRVGSSPLECPIIISAYPADKKAVTAREGGRGLKNWNKSKAKLANFSLSTNVNFMVRFSILNFLSFVLSYFLSPVVSTMHYLPFFILIFSLLHQSLNVRFFFFFSHLVPVKRILPFTGFSLGSSDGAFLRKTLNRSSLVM